MKSFCQFQKTEIFITNHNAKNEFINYHIIFFCKKVRVKMIYITKDVNVFEKGKINYRPVHLHCTVMIPLNEAESNYFYHRYLMKFLTRSFTSISVVFILKK